MTYIKGSEGDFNDTTGLNLDVPLTKCSICSSIYYAGHSKIASAAVTGIIPIAWIGSLDRYFLQVALLSTVKSQFNEWPQSAHFDSLKWDFALNGDFLIWNFNLVTRFCTLNKLRLYIKLRLQRFSEVPDQLGMAILSIIPGNPLLWTFLMKNFNLGIAKMSVIPENPLFPNPVLPKTSVTDSEIPDILANWNFALKMPKVTDFRK